MPHQPHTTTKKTEGFRTMIRLQFEHYVDILEFLQKMIFMDSGTYIKIYISQVDETAILEIGEH